ncbi:hypothetical protein ACO22_03715 [Paracoccidioides brasiliensis]|uniref:MATH and UCH domain-containing protein n=1 Tax=Paracoccidioides brasiliensis TaxID=121759 RepID=A0A1D2JF82_PARBR|nr:hypothetical protein ACO22_03715 [Paracoccidioides brasiliensis]
MDVVFESPVNVERPVAPALPHSSSSPEHPRSRSPFSSQSIMPPSSAFQFNPFSTHTPTAPDRLSQVPDVEGPLQDLVNSSASPRPHPAATAAAVTSFTSSPNPLPPQLDPQPSLEEDAMDTAPDNTQLQPEEVSSNSTPSGRSAGIDPARPAASVMEMDMEMETEQNTNSTINTLPTEGGPPETPTTTETGPLNFPERTTIGVPAMENNSPEPSSQGAPPSEGPLSQELSSPESPDPQAEQNSSPDGSQGNSQQPSVEEEEPADWADIEEDTSAPDEAELKEIESGDADYSALDYDYWEKTFYRELDDPEYKPAEKARLTWIFKGVRGTKENPNRATIMRSPAAYIGGVYWTIKFFPRGNNTGSLSIYLETSSTPPQPDRVVPETEFKVFRGPPNAVLSDLVPEVDITIPATANSSKLSSTQSFTSQGNEKQDPAIEGDSEPAPTEEREGEQKIESPSSSVAPRDWRVSAQIGVILYNPNEPRTAWMQSSCHQFNSHNVDWGWTTFHGPWDRIHQRQRGQRQALLRDDTLAFDAYIRVFDDPTQSLWWHSSDSEPVWDSLSLTGYRPMGDSVVKYSFEVAGLVSWLLLAPFREAIQSVDVLEHFTTPGVKPRPLCESLQKLLWALRSDYHPHLHVDTDFVTRTLRNLEEFSRDVMEFWERLRRSLELELVGTDALEKLSKIFDGQNVSRTITDTTSAEETAPSVNCFHGDFNNSRIRIPAQSSDNIESGLKRYFSGKPGKWSLPAVLHVELARQIFDRASHHWNLISRRVGLDEELDLSGIVAKSRVGRYSLYGFVVHKGKRSSGQFYSILRPGGPGTRWLAFEDASDNKIECLTRKAAIDAHEGVLSEDARSHYDRSGRDVAVVVMYVRNDVLPQFLTGKIEPWKMAEPLRHYFHHGELPFISSSPISIEIYSLEDVSVVNNSLFDAHDLMATARSAGGFRHLTLPANTTFEAVRKKLALWYWKDEQEKKPEHIRMWQIDRPKSGFIPSLLLRNLPALNFPLSYFNLNVLRLWVHILSEDDAKLFAIPTSTPSSKPFDYEDISEEAVEPANGPRTTTDQNSAQEPSVPETQDIGMTDLNPSVHPARQGDSGTTDTISSNQPSETVLIGHESGMQQHETSSSPDHNSPTDDPQDLLNSSVADVQMSGAEPDLNASQPAQSELVGANHNTAAVDNHEPAIDPGNGVISIPVSADIELQVQTTLEQSVDIQEGNENGSPQHANDNINDVATPIAAQEDSVMQDPPLPNTPFDSSSNENGELAAGLERQENRSNEVDWSFADANWDLVPASCQVYYFIQIFDSEKQEFRVAGVFFARKKDAIKSSVSAALGWPDNKQFHLWHRVDGASILSISGSHKFFNIISMDLDGQCFIVGEVLPKSRCTTISERGSFATPDLLSKYLWAFSRRHPTQALTGTKTVEATFNGEYYSGEFKKGYYHGKGTHISDTGATYTGDFVLGQRHGKGIMEFTSGDTYDGDWREDERHGQGTFIERKTGNKYVGGYRAGKRHGKGISYWEVADEEMDLCQICYSEDQDALFYSCGHVCACVSCAKQVDICPMCRKKVTSVVKIYRS